MKQFLALALFTVLSVSAFAQSHRDDSRRNGDDRRQSDNRRGGDINVGRIIGGIIGAIIDSSDLDNDHARRGYRGQVTCYAENRRGDRFKARGNRPRFVQDDAIRACYNYGSRQCFATGCRTDRWN